MKFFYEISVFSLLFPVTVHTQAGKQQKMKDLLLHDK